VSCGASFVRTQQMRREADLCLWPELAQVGLLHSAAHRQIVAAGYQAAMQAAPAPGPFR
jgi:hypothetical protein